jgi:hypothetical protein
MGLSSVKLSEDHRQLMLSIGDAIAAHTTKSPMTLQAIVGVLGFCTGAAICRGTRSERSRRDLRELAVGNVDSGMSAMAQTLPGTSLVIPGMN